MTHRENRTDKYQGIAVLLRTAVIALVFDSASLCLAADGEAKRPHVLIISIDDLNDWVGCLDGHPQTRTPNIDRLANRGTSFTNAHCQAPVCTPSRASLLTGLYPSSTGLYFLQPGLEASAVTQDLATLPEHLRALGYSTMSAGKFVKGRREGQYFDKYGGDMGAWGPKPPEKLQYPDPETSWDWGAYPTDDAEMPDMRIADWVYEELSTKQENPCLFVAGFWRPHVPLTVPSKWFDQFPLDTIQLPPTLASDREDLPQYALDLTVGTPEPPNEWIVSRNKQKEIVQAYLACIAFVDHCVGRVLEALDNGPNRDNTVVVLFSDHGWHLGEKGRWGKRTLWIESTRVPLIIAGPKTTQAQTCNAPVGLIDIYPTLMDLVGEPHPAHLEGRSLVPLLEDPQAAWDRPILTTFGPNNHAIRSRDWTYIRYADGSEELYDRSKDPHEWRNLAKIAAHNGIKTALRKRLPTAQAAPVLVERWQRWGIEAWRNAEANALRRTD
jgi:arylsulfatase A-like enzyme